MRKSWLAIAAIVLLVSACGGADPAATSDPGVGGGGEEGQVVEGGCLPASPLGISPGDSWVIAGPVTVTGQFPGEIPAGTASMLVAYRVTGLEDGNGALAVLLICA